MKHNLTNLMSSASLLALCAQPAQAQDVFDLGEITVFANQTPTEVSRTGATVEILDQEQLQSSSSTTAADTLTRTPGVSASTNGGPGTTTDLRIRGLSGRYIGVRINGIDVTDPASTQTQYNWGGLTTSNLSRIEVLKGSQSAIYGSEAIAGVVNITTTQAPEEIGTVYSFGAEYGTYNTRRADFSIATRGERGDIAFSFATMRTDGFSALDENDGFTEEDGFDGEQAFLSAGYELTDQIRVGVDLIYFNEEVNIDNFGADADRPFFTDRRGVRTYAEIDGGAINHLFEATYFKSERSDPDTPFGSTDFRGDRRELRYRGVADLDRVTLAFGAEYSEESAELADGAQDYDIYSIFGEAQYAVNADLDVSAALRVDDHSEFGTEPTGRVALAWRPQSGTVIRGALGTGFRAPSLNEIYSSFNVGVGNLPPVDLDPEKSRSAELGIEHSYTSGVFIQATAFYTEIDDLIDFVFGTGYIQAPGTSRTQGIELASAAPIGDRIQVFGNYTYTDAEDADGDQLRRVPENDLVLGLATDLTDRLSAELTLNYVTDRVDPEPVDDYTLVNASVSYDLTDSTTVYLRIENLTDEEYQTANGFGTSDRAFYVGIRASF